jgi:hypothetical protein
MNKINLIIKIQIIIIITNKINKVQKYNKNNKHLKIDINDGKCFNCLSSKHQKKDCPEPPYLFG